MVGASWCQLVPATKEHRDSPWQALTNYSIRDFQYILTVGELAACQFVLSTMSLLNAVITLFNSLIPLLDE